MTVLDTQASDSLATFNNTAPPTDVLVGLDQSILQALVIPLAVIMRHAFGEDAVGIEDSKPPRSIAC